MTAFFMSCQSSFNSINSGRLTKKMVSINFEILIIAMIGEVVPACPTLIH